MYQTLTVIHSFVRWLVLASLLFGIFRASRGISGNSVFSKTDNMVRHWTATIAHIQLMTGMVLYFHSPLIKYFWSDFSNAVKIINISFFGVIHILLMFTAIVLLTVGSAMAKRKQADKDKFRTMLLWFSASLVIIFIAVPWPFSPFASRPYLR